MLQHFYWDFPRTHDQLSKNLKKLQQLVNFRYRQKPLSFTDTVYLLLQLHYRQRPANQPPYIQLIRNSDLFKSKQWKIFIHPDLSRSIARINSPEEVQLILTTMVYISEGNFSKFYRQPYYSSTPHLTVLANDRLHSKLCAETVPTYMTGDYIQSFYTILFGIGIQKVPVYNPKTFLISRFNFEPYIEFYWVEHGPVDLYHSTFKRAQKITKNLNGLKYPQSELVFNSSLRESAFHFSNKLKDATIYLQKQRFKPPKIDPLIMHPSIELYYSQSDGTWKQSAETIQKRKFMKQNIQRMQVKSFSNARHLVQLLQKIPHFPVRLTQQQEDVIGTNGDIILIGRSGTGKTTSAILRMFALEVVHRVRQFKDKLKQGFGSEQLQSSIGLRCLFATASPVLTNEIHRYYVGLTGQIKQQLDKKQKARKANELQFQQLEEEVLQMKLEEEAPKEHDDDEEKQNQHFKKAQKYVSLNQFEDSDFPAFLTIKRLILLIDKCLKRPFFYRSKANENVKECIASWHNEEQGVMMIDDYYRKFDADTEEIQAIEFQQQKRTNKGIKMRSDKRGNNRICFEVDYEYFKNHFWPNVKKNYYSGIANSHLIWTQIFSTIKGSIDSGIAGLNRDQYIRMPSSHSLSEKDKIQIFRYYRLYQSWKATLGAYDMMDVVNYLIFHVEAGRYQGPDLHYVMIDEVQDLTYATIKLITLLTKFNNFFSGDTAQCITKGVNFRFVDLMNTIFTKDEQKPTLRQLTTNFRSQDSILQAAHAVVEVIEQLFPETIDKLEKQTSPVKGPKPILNNTNSQTFFLNFLVGSESTELGLNTKVEFGCSQVVIVRNQQSKQKLPPFLQYALCLTIYQCKGLEFNDVILFNFFTESTARWNIMHDLDIKQKKIQCGSKINSNYINHYSELCSDLKLLYVAITRPKKSLIIYDDEPSTRKCMQKIWTDLDLVSICEGKLKASDILFMEKSSQAEWDRQGKVLFKKKIYEQALLCFKYSQNKKMSQTCQAYITAEKAVAKIQLAKQIADEPVYIRTTSKKELKAIRRQAQDLFWKAGIKFTELDMYAQAGRCFFSAKLYAEARESFEKANMPTQVAECLFMSNKYLQAEQIYEKLGNTMKQIECFDMMEDWQSIIFLMDRKRDEFSQKQRNSIFKKYSVLAYNKLLKEIEQNQIIQQVVEEKKKPVQKDAIQEDDEEDSDQEFAERRRQAGKYLLNKGENVEEESLAVTQQVSVVEQIKPQSDMNVSESFAELNRADSSKISESFAQLNRSEVEQKLDESSFDKLNEHEPSLSESFSALNDINFERVKSIVDPQDEWLGESLSAINKETFSEYSVVGETTGVRTNLIKTKCNIMVEDDVMRRLLRIIEASSEQAKKHLGSIRGAKIMEKKEVVSIADDFEVISPELVNLVLDSLESVGLAKLCIFVCNRYNLPERLGRYIVTIGSQYSLISNEYLAVNRGTLIPNPRRKQLLEKGILSYLALHNVLEIVNPEFFKLKSDFENFLGKECVSGLILLGLYKKAAFMLSVDKCLDLLYNFSDINMYTSVFLKNKMNKNNVQISDRFPPIFYCQKAPTTPEQNTMAIFAMENLQQTLMVQNKIMSVITNIYIKQRHDLRKQTPYLSIPEYFEFNRRLWYDKSIELLFENLAKQPSVKTLTGYKLFDYVTASVIALLSWAQHSDHFESISSLPVAMFALKLFRLYLKQLKKFPKGDISKAVLSVFGVKHPTSQYLSFMSKRVICHRGRTIVRRYVQGADKSKDHQIFFIDQGMDNVSVPQKQILSIVSDKIRQSLSAVLLNTAKHLEEQYSVLPQIMVRQDYVDQAKNRIAIRYLEFQAKNVLAITQQKVIKKKKFKSKDSKKKSKQKPIFLMSMVNQAYEENILDSDEDEQDKVVRPQFEFIQTELQNLEPQIQDYALWQYYELKLHRKNNPEPLHKIGLNKHYGQVARKNHNDGIFQAFQFKKFYRLDDYQYHLKKDLNLLDEQDKFEYILEIIIIILIKQLMEKKYEIEFKLPEPFYRFFQINDSRHEFLWVSEEDLSVNDWIKQLDMISQASNIKDLHALAVFITVNRLDARIDSEILRLILKALSDLANVRQLANFLQPYKHEQVQKILLMPNQWKSVWHLRTVSFINKSNKQSAFSKSEADYWKYQVRLVRRLLAAKTIKKAIKKYIQNKKEFIDEDPQQISKDCDELISDMVYRYYVTEGVTSYDIHFLLGIISQTLKVKQLNEKLAFEEVKNKIHEWNVTESTRFQTQELNKTQIQQIKWIARNRKKIIKL